MNHPTKGQGDLSYKLQVMNAVVSETDSLSNSKTFVFTSNKINMTC